MDQSQQSALATAPSIDIDGVQEFVRAHVSDAQQSALNIVSDVEPSSFNFQAFNPTFVTDSVVRESKDVPLHSSSQKY